MTCLKRLADAEVNAPRARFRLAIHLQVRNAIQLKPEVDACRTDRGEIPQSGAHGIQERRRNVERSVRHVAEIEKRDASELADERLTDFCRALEHRQPADRQSETAERADLEPSPAADARCAA